MITELYDSVFSIGSENDFWELTRRAYDYQSVNNRLYKEFVTFLGRNRGKDKPAGDIPFLPVELFRNHRIVAGDRPVEIVFESSGTSGVTPGRHYVSDLSLYERSFLKTFRLFYGDPGDYLIIALLPSYTERGGSSLVYMTDKIIKESHNSQSGFYRGETDAIVNAVKKARETGSRILLLGVSYALLDLAESGPYNFEGVTVMETGGMKGRRKELTRAVLHDILKEKFNVDTIHSEYGMTELMTQAYSSGEGIFYCPPWMRIILRDPHDPLSLFSQPGKTGGINIIDLANLNSCSFIATGDLGKLHEDGGFEVLGRFDNSDIRGCNLLAE